MKKIEKGVIKLSRSGLYIILQFVVILGFIWLHHDKSPNFGSSVTVSGWSSGIGAVSSNDTNVNEQKLSFSATIWNNTNHTVYVTNVKVNLPSSLENHIASGNTHISVNRSMEPNSTAQITGQFILDTKGLTKEQIVNLGKIQGFTVNIKS
ncbi:MAG: hypothetical protein Q8934_21765 [Bacillota bacterium]|nr:hypothetical protein [Bacillota bacterium]